MKIFKLCYKYLIPNIISIIFLIVLSVLSSLISILIPYISGNFIDSLIYNARIDDIYRFCTLIVILNIGSLLMQYFLSILYVRIQMKSGYYLNRDLVSFIQDLSLSFSENKDLVYLSQITNIDANTLIIFCITIIQNIIINVFYIVSAVIIVMNINLYTAVIVIVAVFIYVFFFIVFKKPLYITKKILSEEQSKYFQKLFEQFSSIKFIKYYSVKEVFVNKLNDAFAKLYDITIKNQRLSYLYSSTDSVISLFVQIILYIVGGVQVIRGNLTIGLLTVFFSYFNIIISSIKYFFGLGKTYQETLVSYDRICELYNNKLEPNGTEKVDSVQQININHLYFKYKSSNKHVFQNLSLNFNKGNIYGLVGTNGSGKSTLVNLILGMYIDEYDGYIKINDGFIYTQLNMIDLRKEKIGISQQEPTLLSDSIFANLLIDKAYYDKNSEHINKLISILQLDSYFNGLDSGLDTIINSANDNLSGGEKQKISLLRALIKDADVLILDEPTSALDYISSQRLMDYLHLIKDDKIIIIVTHDKSMIEKFNVVYNLECLNSMGL